MDAQSLAGLKSRAPMLAVSCESGLLYMKDYGYLD